MEGIGIIELTDENIMVKIENNKKNYLSDFIYIINNFPFKIHNILLQR